MAPAAAPTGGDAAKASTGDTRPPCGVPLPRMLAAYAQEPLIGREREVGPLGEAEDHRGLLVQCEGEGSANGQLARGGSVSG
jgi:hypothetical protein